jgi:3-oxoacyl-[acyl-carrier-protein] synthase II
MNKKRVVITGLGAISPLGLSMEENWKNLINGVNGIKPAERFSSEEFRTHNAGEVAGFDIKDFIKDKDLSKIGLCSKFGLAASKMAIENSSLKTDGTLRIGVSVGTTMGDVQEMEKVDEVYYNEGFEKINPKMMLNYPSHEIAKNIAWYFGFCGPNNTFTTACASGNYAYGYAYDCIKNGTADIMVAGGADVLSRVAYAGFNRLFAVAPEMCQPFCLDRKGMIVSEGAAFMVFESLESAQKRGVRILAEFIGYGLSCDAFDITIPHENGLGAIEVMQNALRNSKIMPEKIGYINTHGTGTKENDRVESLSVKEVFKEHAKKLSISSTKSMTGHLMGASSALEGCISVKVLGTGIMPPTINYTVPDPECDLDVVPNKAKEKNIDYVMSNAFAFGGNNASIIVKKFES